MTWPAARRLSSGALSPGAVARRPTHHTTLAVRRPLLVVRCSSLVARITLRVTRRSLFVARCSLSVGPSLAPECTQSLLVASSLWGLTACRYAVATSGAMILGVVGCDQHHRLVRPERERPSFSHVARCSPPRCSSPLPVERNSLFVEAPPVTRCPLPVARHIVGAAPLPRKRNPQTAARRHNHPPGFRFSTGTPLEDRHFAASVRPST